MAKRLVLLFDGTWNTEKSYTNVFRMEASIFVKGFDGLEQIVKRFDGVGTKIFTYIRGGIFGRGLMDKITEGYAWLVNNYQEGDEIFLFGFSRGAYTARSLVGMLRKSGLVKNAVKIKDAVRLYKDKAIAPEDGPAIEFRQLNSLEVRVKFIGVWDTVGSLGIPDGAADREAHSWHDTELSKIVDYAYHAVAIDEERPDFCPTLWTKIKPENIEVEQRWFVGVHSNVGGGYQRDPLPDKPLRWLQEKAQKCGLNTKFWIIDESDYIFGHLADSFAECAGGFYGLFQKRYMREIGKTGVNERLDESVRERWEGDKDYNPKALQRFVERDGWAKISL